MGKYRLLFHEIIGFTLVTILGILNHFIYEWSNKNSIIGLFAATSESTWEHLKLLFIPFLIITIIEYYILGKRYNNFLLYKLFGVLLGMLFIIVAFYLFTGILGRDFLWIDITIFILGVFFSFYYSHRFILRNPVKKDRSLIGVIGLILFTLLFIVFTYLPPEIPLFTPPDSYLS
ncbi:hypothetical protein lbkm_2743 [Lachnospiraceae bacterium KM106-2]|nr:hypothetical protein lbkm_2743 [Lachnospiraceae bacterium KM106-2]